MPLYEKIKSEGGKSTLRSTKNLKGQTVLKWKDVEYPTENSPRVVAKKTETLTNKGIITREKIKVGGKTKSDTTYFTPKKVIGRDFPLSPTPEPKSE